MIDPRSILQPLRRRALLIGIAGTAALAAGSWGSPEAFFESYLFGYVVLAGVSLGCLGLLMLHHLVSGRWGHVIQRVLEAGARSLPLMLVLFLPVVAGLEHLYSWTHVAEGGGHGHVAAKAAYLNVPFFLARSAFYFLFWIAMAYVMSALSRKQDQTGDARLTRRLKIMSAPGLIAFVVLGTFASVDWMMSLEPEWFSAIYGLMIMTAQAISALAFAIVMLRLLADTTPLAGLLTETHVHHLGNMLLALTVFWTYLAFSQYLIIWSGNLPEENFWYIHRLTPGWSAVAVVILIGHFFIPFLLLLSRRMKRALRPLSLIAGGLLIMRCVEYFWLVKPAFASSGFHWMDLAALAGIGGLWTAWTITHVQGASVTVLRDPRFENGELSRRS
jgi:hypothetical protein